MPGVSLSSTASKKGKRRWRLLFFDMQDRTKRRQIALGAIPKTEAEQIKSNVERLRASRLAGTTAPDAINTWLAELPTEWHDKLEAASLVDPRQSGQEETPTPTLGEMVDRFKATGHWASLAEGTQKDIAVSFRHMLTKYGAKRPIDELTAGHAAEFRSYLELPEPAGRGVSPSTASKCIVHAKALFNLAVDYELIAQNPFRKQKTPRGAAEKAFVDAETAREVMVYLPDDEWRLMFALARWGGVRMTSEIVDMRWRHVDWDARLLTVLSPKTKRHPGRDKRLVPIFDEIAPLLEKRFVDSGAISVADPGDELVMPTAHYGRRKVYRGFVKAIKAAGLEPWPELNNSMRSTRETELAREHPAHVVTAILGNSIKVANAHYLQTTPEELTAMATRTKAHTESKHGESQRTAMSGSR